MLPVYLLIASLVTGADLTESPCLLSDVLCTTADYQLRRYKESVWVGTHVDVSISPKVDTSMQRLISYTRGGNSEELWIQSNGQFLISFTGDGEIKMYLLVPEELWENPPTPTSPQAFITRFPTMDVLSRRIRWNAMTQANDFNRTLTEQNAKFNNSFFFVSFCKGRSRCKTSPRPRRYNKRQFSFLGPFEGLRKRSIRTSAGALTSGERTFWGAEVSIGGVSYDFSSMPAGNEVWFVATGEMDCPLM